MGPNGFLRQLTDALFGQDMLFPAYGLEMVILAHVLFNAPLVMRVVWRLCPDCLIITGVCRLSSGFPVWPISDLLNGRV